MKPPMLRSISNPDHRWGRVDADVAMVLGLKHRLEGDRVVLEEGRDGPLSQGCEFSPSSDADDALWAWFRLHERLDLRMVDVFEWMVICTTKDGKPYEVIMGSVADAVSQALLITQLESSAVSAMLEKRGRQIKPMRTTSIAGHPHSGV